LSGATPSPVVFNVVWTGRVFDHLAPFVASQVHHSDARFRFIANACPADQLDAMERFAARFPGRVVEVLEISSQVMLRHGAVLDQVLATRDDGELFSLIDPDIAARGPFLPRFRELLATHDAVTSGKEVWSEHNVRPAEHPGVNGEYFFDQDGFVFGSPHLAFYRADALRGTIDRWGVGFGSSGNDLPEPARARLEEVGRGYWVYDTGKIVNILLQADGHPLGHVEHPALVHIGGVSHLLAPPASAPAAQGKPVKWGEGDWSKEKGMADRFAVAQFAASVIQDLTEGRPCPPVPVEEGSRLWDRLALVRDVLVELHASFGADFRPISSGADPRA
jgi:hypothetical protein